MVIVFDIFILSCDLCTFQDFKIIGGVLHMLLSCLKIQGNITLIHAPNKKMVFSQMGGYAYTYGQNFANIKPKLVLLVTTQHL